MHKLLWTECGPSGGYVTGAERDAGTGPRIVVLYADHATQNALRAWAEAAGFDLGWNYGGEPAGPEGIAFHITLLVTANDVAIPLTDHLVEPIEAEPVGFGILGRDEDTPVIKLAGGGQLALMREHFIETYGAEPTFPDFKPHVSLSYNWDGAPALEDLDLPGFPLVFDRLCVKPFEAGGSKASAPGEQKMPVWLELMLGIGMAGGALAVLAIGGWLLVDGVVWLTEQALGRIIDYFRGEEAVLLEQIAEKETELAEADSNAGGIRAELEDLRRRLAEVRGAMAEARQAPILESAGAYPGDHKAWFADLIDWGAGLLRRHAGKIVIGGLALAAILLWLSQASRARSRIETRISDAEAALAGGDAAASGRAAAADLIEAQAELAELGALENEMLQRAAEAELRSSNELQAGADQGMAGPGVGELMEARMTRQEREEKLFGWLWGSEGDRLAQAIAKAAGDLVAAAESVQSAVEEGGDAARSTFASARTEINRLLTRLDGMLEGERQLREWSEGGGKAVMSETGLRHGSSDLRRLLADLERAA